MAKKYKFVEKTCSCGQDLSEEKGEVLADDFGACPQCGRRLELDTKKAVTTPEPPVEPSGPEPGGEEPPPGPEPD